MHPAGPDHRKECGAKFGNKWGAPLTSSSVLLLYVSQRRNACRVVNKQEIDISPPRGARFFLIGTRPFCFCHSTVPANLTNKRQLQYVGDQSEAKHRNASSQLHALTSIVTGVMVATFVTHDFGQILFPPMALRG